MKFKFIEFNPRRAMRGADAARVQVTDDEGVTEWLWMSKRDIANNMTAFGRCEELEKAQAAYSSASTGRTASSEAGEATQERGAAK